MNFCSRFLGLSVLPWCRERPQIVICWLEWLGRSKCQATGLDASLSFLSTSRRCLRKRSPSETQATRQHNVCAYDYHRYVTSGYQILRFCQPTFAWSVFTMIENSLSKNSCILSTPLSSTDGMMLPLMCDITLLHNLHYEDITELKISDEF